MTSHMIGMVGPDEQAVTLLFPVYGHHESSQACRAAVWKFDRYVHTYYTHMGAKFQSLLRRDGEIVEVVLDAFPREFRWLDDDRFDVRSAVPDFNDTGKPRKVAHVVYDMPNPELDTDDDRVVLSREGIRFRTVRGSTTEHYETESMAWDRCARLFK